MKYKTHIFDTIAHEKIEGFVQSGLDSGLDVKVSAGFNTALSQAHNKAAIRQQY